MTVHRFTIAIPTHDRRDTVVLAVLSALRQTRSPEQVLVLCDGCTDGTADAVRTVGDERAVPLELPKGPGFAYTHRNEALRRARGDVVLWLADDDLLLPDHLERIGEYWDRGQFEVVTTPAAIVHPDDSLEWIGQDWSAPWHRESMDDNNTNVMASVSVTVEIARRAGGWRAEHPRAEDWQLWKRVLALGARAGMTNEPTVLHFRATNRDQAWPDRVRQNAAWLERISDPTSLSEVRWLLQRLSAQRDTALQDVREDERRRHLEREAGLERTIAELERNVEAERRMRVDREAELQHVYGGGWWRLRSRLLPLMRIAGKGEE
jgi:glycosyltransferase involved in cell wall biosynthesis